WGCVREVNKERFGRSYWKWFRQSRSSALVVVFGEDIAALLGLVAALVAVSLTMITGNPVYDALGTIFIGILLLVIALFIAREVKALLIGQGVDPRVLSEMKHFLSKQAEVEKVYNVLTLHMGDDVMVAVKARMVSTGSETGLLQAVNRVETGFRTAFPQIVWLFFEPDSTDEN
ncbi:MAG: cation efflux family transporter, partial [Gammaproteobacteria bacterium]|nr:cation efflux family transporter [Gammaproteobacteria bacterium]